MSSAALSLANTSVCQGQLRLLAARCHCRSQRARAGLPRRPSTSAASKRGIGRQRIVGLAGQDLASGGPRRFFSSASVAASDFAAADLLAPSVCRHCCAESASASMTSSSRPTSEDKSAVAGGSAARAEARDSPQSNHGRYTQSNAKGQRHSMTSVPLCETCRHAYFCYLGFFAARIRSVTRGMILARLGVALRSYFFTSARNLSARVSEQRVQVLPDDVRDQLVVAAFARTSTSSGSGSRPSILRAAMATCSCTSGEDRWPRAATCSTALFVDHALIADRPARPRRGTSGPCASAAPGETSPDRGRRRRSAVHERVQALQPCGAELVVEHDLLSSFARESSCRVIRSCKQPLGRVADKVVARFEPLDELLVGLLRQVERRRPAACPCSARGRAGPCSRSMPAGSRLAS